MAREPVAVPDEDAVADELRAVQVGGLVPARGPEEGKRKRDRGGKHC